jgi:hypothetical protein
MTMEEAEEDDELYDSEDRGHRSYSQVICDGVLSIIELTKEDENNKEREKEEELQKEFAEQGNCKAIKAAALGRLKKNTLSNIAIPACTAARPVSTGSVMLEDNNTTISAGVATATPQKGNRNVGKDSGRGKGPGKGKHGIANMEAIAKAFEEQKKKRTECQLKREERKVLEAQNEKLRLENQKRETELKAQTQREQTQMMVMMMEKFLEKSVEKQH